MNNVLSRLPLNIYLGPICIYLRTAIQQQYMSLNLTDVTILVGFLLLFRVSVAYGGLPHVRSAHKLLVNCFRQKNKGLSFQSSFYIPSLLSSFMDLGFGAQRLAFFF